MDSIASPERRAVVLSAGRRNYILLVLTVIYTLAFVDRQIINILAEQIKHELNLADWQMGALAGFAFAMLYSVLCLPVARYSERGNRPRVIATALLLWSGFTALSGMAGNFTHLMLARIGVGVGETGCVAPSHSLITDITSREKRAGALAIFSTGIPLGSLVGLGIGGLVAHAYGWRMAFFLCGAPGVIIALLVLATIRDPRIKSLRDAARPDAHVPTLWEAFTQLRKRRSFVWLTAGAAMVTFIAMGQQTFYASFFLRNHGLDLEKLAAMSGLNGRLGVLGVCLGLIVGIGGTLGSLIGGRLADKVVARKAGVYVTVPIYSTLASIPLFAGVFLAPTGGMALIMLALATFFSMMWFGPVFASVQSLVLPGTRAIASALFLFLVNMFGVGCGPVVMGALSDLLAHTLGSANGLRWAMVTFAFLLLIPARCFAIVARTLSDETVS